MGRRMEKRVVEGDPSPNLGTAVLHAVADLPLANIQPDVMFRLRGELPRRSESVRS
jgi:hypothetical protein